jgi:hypothetical protein
VQISTVEGRFGDFLAIFGKNAGKTAFMHPFQLSTIPRCCVSRCRARWVSSLEKSCRVWI